MEIFDYNCYVEHENCPLLNSDGQEFTHGAIYAINKKLTKKIFCWYSGYGYARLKCRETYKDDDNKIYDLIYLDDNKIYDLIYLNDGGRKDNINDKSSYFACPNCSKSIKNELNNWKDFYDPPNPIDDIKENIENYEKKLKYFIKKKDKIKNKINQTNLLLEKEIEKLYNYVQVLNSFKYKIE